MNGEVLAEKTKKINEIISGYLPYNGGKTSHIEEAMRYCVEAGGKRLRPLLMQETFRLFTDKENSEMLERFMSAIEFIHTYSLAHDDLPAMDNDMYRRGKLTAHAAFGEAFGILAGDALLNWAFETVLDGIVKLDDPAEIKKAAAAAQILGQKAGIRGMVGGQCLDVYSEKTEGFVNDLDGIKYIHKNKTAALLEASMMIGAILAGAGDEDIKAVEMIAENVGMAFQIRDDILDVVGNSETLGKSTGNDEKNNKETYVTLVGLSQAQKDVEVFSENAVAGLDSLPYKNEFLRDLILYLVNRNK